MLSFKAKLPFNIFAEDYTLVRVQNTTKGAISVSKDMQNRNDKCKQYILVFDDMKKKKEKNPYIRTQV